jgi:hypothetical protein
LKKSDFTFDLPPELIAQAPLPERSASRMLVIPPRGEGEAVDAGFVDAGVRDLPAWLQPGDLLVFNDTRVIPARIFGNKATGGRVEILVERLLGDHEARVQMGVSKSPKPGMTIHLDAGGVLTVLGREESFYRVRFDPSAKHGDSTLEKFLLRAGRLPLPPYIERLPGEADAERYQTVFAREVGAVAAPTAGLHFDEALLEAVRALGVPATLCSAADAPQVAPDGPACFAAPAAGELAVHGRKLIGSAVWRSSAAYLQHGAILLRDTQERLSGFRPRAHAAEPPAHATDLAQWLAPSLDHPGSRVTTALHAAWRATAPLAPLTDWPDADQHMARHMAALDDPQWLWRR